MNFTKPQDGGKDQRWALGASSIGPLEGGMVYAYFKRQVIGIDAFLLQTLAALRLALADSQKRFARPGFTAPL